jgi:uncharacterized protein DUF4041/Meiotically Up-regulated Gene 113 (MUG113) protein
MSTATLLLVAIVGLIAVLTVVVSRYRSLSAAHTALSARFKAVTDVDAERTRVLDALNRDRSALDGRLELIRTETKRAETVAQDRQTASEAELKRLQSDIDRLKTELAALDEEANLQSFGFYKPHYGFAESATYQNRLDDVWHKQKDMLKQKIAATCRIEWTVNGSKVEGRKQTNQLLRLMLRAFNGEADAAIAKVKYNNVLVMEARIRKAWETINGLCDVQQCVINPVYRDLKIDELRLSYEYEEKLFQEKEEQRRIKEQMREEELALREIERAREEAEREEKRFGEALEKARAQVESAEGAKRGQLQSKIEDLEQKLAEAQAKAARAISRAQQTRSGHVYVISNIGSFGEHVYKIGMTRRLEPLDRIRELGDASVPFQFDVHAIIYSDDAPALESTLHQLFEGRRVNRVNERKEFFKLPIDDVAAAVRAHRADIQFTLAAEAAEYRKTLALLLSTREDGSHLTSEVKT